MKNIIIFPFVWVMVILIACCGDKNNNIRKQKRFTYEEVYKKDLIGAESNEIKSLLGIPDSIREGQNRQIWSYGPSVDDMIDSENGEIVGLTIYFNEKGTVMSVRPKEKTNIQQLPSK